MKKRLYRVPMRDGTELVTWVSLPGDGTGKYDVILIRNPYVEAPPEDTPFETEAEDDAFARNGFVFVMQHCRGRGGSDGDFIPFCREKEDGLDAIAWIEKQPWAKDIYLMGGSYLGYVQLAMLADLPESVKGAYMAVMTNSAEKLNFKNGVLKADICAIWYLGMYHAWDLVHKDPYKSYEEEWFKNPMSEYGRRVWGYDVEPFNNAFTKWDDPVLSKDYGMQALDAMRKCRIPIVMETGWTEPFFNGTWEMWKELPEEIREKSAFLVGPWSHGPVIPENWPYPFENAEYDEITAIIDWSDHIRYGNPSRFLKEGYIKYYEVGKASWAFAKDWPEGETKSNWYLGKGGLTEEKPAEGEVSYDADPLNPASFPGGPCTFATGEVGFAKQPEPNFRDDVKSFLSAPLKEELHVAGRIGAALEVSTDRDATMFLIRVSCVTEKGDAVPMQDCPVILKETTPGEKMKVEFLTDPIVWTLHKGERIRLDVASADAHSYRVHTNVRGDWFAARDTAVAHNTVYFGESVLTLPTVME
ncbi:MAG: CocE/NonD family hydrolase [Clostridia bacterium]|nr:CocE/NonD family hydrolase [Clostridia bacterium]